MAAAPRIVLEPGEREELERIVSAASSEVRMVQRARIVLAAAEGGSVAEMTALLGCSRPTIAKWRGRYAERRLEGLRDAPRSGAPLTHGPQTRALLIAKACTRPEPTAEGARRERWTYEELGAEVGMSGSQAHAILSARRHQAAPRIRFLDRCDEEIPVAEGQRIVAITDNLSTRNTDNVQKWLKRHPRWSFQFTPKHASWLNQVEIFFSILCRRLLKNGAFTSEQDLAEQMLAFIETYNQTAKPFKWTYTGKVLEA